MEFTDLINDIPILKFGPYKYTQGRTSITFNIWIKQMGAGNPTCGIRVEGTITDPFHAWKPIFYCKSSVKPTSYTEFYRFSTVGTRPSFSFSSNWNTINGILQGAYGSTTFSVYGQSGDAEDAFYLGGETKSANIYYNKVTYSAEGNGKVSSPGTFYYNGGHSGKKLTATPNSNESGFSKWEVSGSASFLRGYSATSNPTYITVSSSGGNGAVKAIFKDKIHLTSPTPSVSKTSFFYGENVVYTWATQPNVKYRVYVTGSGGSWWHPTDKTQESQAGYLTSGTYTDHFSMQRIGNTYQAYVKAYDNGGGYVDASSVGSPSKTFTICGKVIFYNGTSVVSTKIVSVLPSNQFPTAPTKTGYTFDGWWTAQSGGNQKISCSTDEIRAAGTLNLYAHWKVKSFTIKFISAHGACTPSQDTANYGTVYSLSGKSAPPYSGYRHTGWSKSSGGNKVYGLTDSFTVDGDITLYAYYEANYNVEYNLNAPKSIADNIPFPVIPQSITGGEKIKGQPFPISSVVPAITGYEFVNWTDDDNTAYQPGDNYIKDNGTTLKANWRAKNYTVTYKPSSNGPQFAPFTQSISFNTAPILPDYPNYDRELYRPKTPFWIVQNNGQIVAQGIPGDTYPMIYANDNTVIIPQWTQITYWRGGWLWIYVPEEGGFQ